MKTNKSFAVFCLAKEVRAMGGSIVTDQGTGFWVTNEDDGWVDATGRRSEKDSPLNNVKVWSSKEKAESFMKNWHGHPWYYIPKSWEVVRVHEVMKQVFSHYAVVGTEP